MKTLKILLLALCTTAQAKNLQMLVKKDASTEKTKETSDNMYKREKKLDELEKLQEMEKKMHEMEKMHEDYERYTKATCPPLIKIATMEDSLKAEELINDMYTGYEGGQFIRIKEYECPADKNSCPSSSSKRTEVEITRNNYKKALFERIDHNIPTAKNIEAVKFLLDDKENKEAMLKYALSDALGGVERAKEDKNYKLNLAVLNFIKSKLNTDNIKIEDEADIIDAVNTWRSGIALSRYNGTFYEGKITDKQIEDAIKRLDL